MLGVVPFLIVLGTCWLVASLVLRYSPFFRARLAATQGAEHLLPLDGLRGTLVLLVVAHHAALHRRFVAVGDWRPDGSRWILENLAASSVMLFFFLSGFLFWSRLLTTNGRLGLRNFVEGRLRRLLPAYLLALLGLVAIVAVESRFQRLEPIPVLAVELLRWLCFGLPEGFFPAINGQAATFLFIAGVVWSLRWEVLFYMTLPWFAFLARKHWTLLFLIAFPLAHFVARFDFPYRSTVVEGILYLGTAFGGGMIAAYLRQRHPLRLGKQVLTALLLGGVVVATITDARPWTAGMLVANRLGLLAIFLPLVYGNDLFGFLTARPLRLLGTVSYALYLFHGLVLYAGLHWSKPYLHADKLGDIGYWALVVPLAGLATLLSVGSFRYVEARFLLGKKSATSFKAEPPMRRAA